jgi:hypothetical protein
MAMATEVFRPQMKKDVFHGSQIYSATKIQRTSSLLQTDKSHFHEEPLITAENA